MSDTVASRGSLFTPDFLTDSIREVDDWNTLAEDDLNRFKETVEEIFASFPISQRSSTLLYTERMSVAASRCVRGRTFCS